MEGSHKSKQIGYPLRHAAGPKAVTEWRSKRAMDEISARLHAITSATRIAETAPRAPHEVNMKPRWWGSNPKVRPSKKGNQWYFWPERPLRGRCRVGAGAYRARLLGQRQRCGRGHPPVALTKRKSYSSIRQTIAARSVMVMNLAPYVAESQARLAASNTEAAPELFPSSPVQK